MKDEAVAHSDKRELSVDQIYRDLVEDYKYHLGWRERLLFIVASILVGLALSRL